MRFLGVRFKLYFFGCFFRVLELEGFLEISGVLLGYSLGLVMGFFENNFRL